MAITNNSKLISEIKNQSSNTQTGCGCGAMYIPAGKSLPAGDYVKLKATSGLGLRLLNIVWKGEGWYDEQGALLTAVVLDARSPWYWEMNIESCDVDAGGGDALFYKRCK